MYFYKHSTPVSYTFLICMFISGGNLIHSVGTTCNVRRCSINATRVCFTLIFNVCHVYNILLFM